MACAMDPVAACGGGGGGVPALGDGRNDRGGDAGDSKRRRTAVSAETAIDVTRAQTQNMAELEASVARRDCQIAALAADNAGPSIEATVLRPRLPAAALQQLVLALGARERDLRDRVFELACMPRYLATCSGDLPPDPAGALGTFAVTVPSGTIAVARDAFTDCEGLVQVTLPVTAGIWRGAS